MNEFAYDALFLGGGISGLSILNRFQALGYRACLIEKEALGMGQSIASQGILYLGQKYRLSGRVDGITRQLRDMPPIWRACLAGRGEVDLTTERVLPPANTCGPIVL